MAFAGKLAAFSRTQEQDADDTGYQLLVMAHFEPTGALNAARLLAITAGNAPTEFFSTHPGWSERYTRLEQVAKADIQKREQAQIVDAQRAIDDQNIEFAERLLSTRSWKDLAPFVRTWLDTSPESGAAWYYQGLLLKRSRGNGRQAINAFESAVKFDSRNANAWFELCELLIKSGYRRESAHCGRDMQGTGLYGEFRENVYQDTLFSHGREIIPPRPLWMGKDERDATLITNDEATRRGWNVSPDPVPPSRTILKSQ
jgi:tetratricopeptide (TPR) repeat protein